MSACLRAYAGEPEPPPALLPEPPSVQIDKNRFISFAFPDAPEGTQWAVRVKVVELYNTDPNHSDLEACPASSRYRRCFGAQSLQ